MNKLLFALLLLPVIALADWRIDQTQQACHFPVDANNTDNEHYVEPWPLDYHVYEDAAGNGQAVCKAETRLPEFLMPAESLVFTSEGTGKTCTIVNAAGGEYTSNNWIATITVKDHKKHSKDKVEFSIECRDGAN